MKKAILSFLIFFSFPVFSQTVNPFNLDHVEWVIFSCGWNSSPPPSYYYFTHYRLCGDTFYQGKNYKRIFVGMATQYASGWGWGPVKPYPVPSSYSFYGFFRQDSVLKESYLRLPGWNYDSLLVSYNLNISDVITRGLYYETYLNGPSPGIGPLTVFSTDSVVVGGQKFKTYATDSSIVNYIGNSTKGYFLVEGLGHINGVFEYYMAQEFYAHPFENCPGVDTVIFNCDCAHLAGIVEEKKSRQLDVYPIPANDRLQFTEGFSGVLRIVNSLGETVMRVDCRNCTEVDVSSLLPQSYLLEMESEKGINRRKFIKH